MKAFVTPVVTEKVRTLDDASKREMSAFLDSLATLTPIQLEGIRRRSAVLDKDKNIFSLRQHLLHIFYSIGEMEGEPYFLVLDVVSAVPGAAIPVENPDPRINPSLNPYVNTALNPYVNSRLNPFVNSALNPYVNSTLNPHVNTLLNPFVNSRLNPFVNTVINPLVNTSINPAVNPAVNPFLNPHFQGLRFYDLNLFPQGFGIQADNDVILRFDSNLNFQGIGVRNSVGGYILFDPNNNWIGYLVPDQQGGYLNFGLEAGWCGLVTV
jgi:hypothetical protein